MPELERRVSSINDLLMQDRELNELRASLEVQDEFLSENSEEQPLLDSLEDLFSENPEKGRQVFDYISNLVKKNVLSVSSIPYLITNIQFTDTARKALLEDYGATGAAASWLDYKILLHSQILEKDKDGKDLYNLSHHLGHEIGHSIFESGAINLEGIKEIFRGVGTDFESRHILSIASNISEELLLKERFSELFSLYVRCMIDGGDFESFAQSRRLNCLVEDDFRINDKEREASYIEETKLLFSRIKQIWPSIISNLELLKIEDRFEEKDEFLKIEDKPSNIVSESADNVDLSVNQEIIHGNNQTRSASSWYKETPFLAKSEKHGESFLASIAGLVISLGEELREGTGL